MSSGHCSNFGSNPYNNERSKKCATKEEEDYEGEKGVVENEEIFQIEFSEEGPVGDSE